MKKNQKGFSLIELLIVVAIILIIAAIAIPNLLRARIAANESSAVGSIRTLVTANVTYQSTWGTGFAAGLANLGGASPCHRDCGRCLLDRPGLGGGNKSGYSIFDIGGAAVAGVVPTFVVYADPQTVGQTGQRAFCSDESGVVRFDVTGTMAPATDAACEAFPPLQ